MNLRLQRIHRELFLAGFGVQLHEMVSWVLDRLTHTLEEREVHAGDVLWREGAPLADLYLMHDGRVRLVRDGAAPCTCEGRWFLGGFEAHLDRAPRTAVADSSFQAMTMPRAAWLDLLEDSAELLRRSVVAAATAVSGLDGRPSATASAAAVTLWARTRKLDGLERLALLHQLELTRGAEVQALAELAAASRPVTVAGGEPLFRRGDPPTHLYLIVDGEVAHRGPAAAQAMHQGPGELVGRAAGFGRRIRDWEAHAVWPSRLLAIPADSWFDLMEEHFGLARALLRQLAVWREQALDQLAIEAGPTGLALAA